VTRSEVLAWLQSRVPAPPAALTAKLADCVAAAPGAALDGDSVADTVGRLGLATLHAVVERQSVAYDAAMDLLAADAFLTYAFEAAAEDGAELPALASRLLGAVGT
jgi:hypothetical protein